MDKVNEYLRRTLEYNNYINFYIRPRMRCADGFSISIQAGFYRYCRPRNNEADTYESVELRYPNMEDPIIADYAENPDDLTETVYKYVPIEVVNELIEKHGGIVN